MQVFINFQKVERDLSNEVHERINTILLTEVKNGRPSEDIICDYLCHPGWENRLQVIVGLSGGSLERLQRVCDVILPKGKKFSSMKTDEAVRRKVANFLANPEQYKKDIPPFICDCFCLLPNWMDVLRSKKHVNALVLNTLQPKYAVAVGFALEKSIADTVSRMGLSFEKGKVDIVDNKEVDVAIPSTKNPKVLIMSSYALTTSSAQSSKANEQMLMYESVQSHNRRKGDNVKMLNVIDGGGWLARKRDLGKIQRHSDKSFSYEDIISGGLQAYLEEVLNKKNIG